MAKTRHEVQAGARSFARADADYARWNTHPADAFDVEPDSRVVIEVPLTTRVAADGVKA